MPIYTVKAPNGRTYEMRGPAGLPKDVLVEHILAKDPDAWTPPPPPQTGWGAALKSGLENMISSGAAGIKGLYDPEGAAAEAAAAEKAQAAKYDPQVGLQRIAEAYNAPEGGIMAAGKEIIGQAPRAILQSAPEMGAMALGARLGAGVGSFFGPVGTVAGGVLGGIAGGILPQTGRNLAEQQKEHPGEISYGKAVAAGAGQAALEEVTPLALMGSRVAGKVFGKDMAGIVAKLGPEAAEEIAARRLSATVAKGAVHGALGEGSTEVLQEMLQRQQAGQDLLSQDALKAYAEAAYGGALAGAPLGGAGHVYERAGARTEVADKERAAQALASQKVAEEQAALQQQQEAELAAKRADPDYANKTAVEYHAFETQKRDLLDRRRELKGDTTEAGKLEYRQLGEQIGQLIKDNEPLTAEFLATKQVRDAQVAEQQQREAERAAADERAGVPAAEPGMLFGGYGDAKTQERVDQLKALIAEHEQAQPELMAQARQIQQNGTPEQVNQANAGLKKRGKQVADLWEELNALDPRIAQEREKQAAAARTAEAAATIDPVKTQQKIDALAQKRQGIEDPVAEAGNAARWVKEQARLKKLLDEHNKQKQAAAAEPAAPSPYAEDLFQQGERLARTEAKSERRQAGQQAGLEAAGRGEMTRTWPGMDLGAEELPGTPHGETPEGMARETEAAFGRTFATEEPSGMLGALGQPQRAASPRLTEAMRQAAREGTATDYAPEAAPGRTVPGKGPAPQVTLENAQGQGMLFTPEGAMPAEPAELLRQRVGKLLAMENLRPQARETLQRAADLLDARDVPQRVQENIANMVAQAERSPGALTGSARPQIQMREGKARTESRAADVGLEEVPRVPAGPDVQPDLFHQMYVGRTTPERFQRALDTGALPSERGLTPKWTRVSALRTAEAMLRVKAEGLRARVADAANAVKRLKFVNAKLAAMTPEQRKRMSDTVRREMLNSTQEAHDAVDRAKRYRALAEAPTFMQGADAAAQAYEHNGRAALADQEAERHAAKIEDYKTILRAIDKADAAPALKEMAARHDALKGELAAAEKDVADNATELQQRLKVARAASEEARGHAERAASAEAGLGGMPAAGFAAPAQVAEAAKAKRAAAVEAAMKKRKQQREEAQRAKAQAAGTSGAEYAARTGENVRRVEATEKPGEALMSTDALADAITTAMETPGVTHEDLRAIAARIDEYKTPRAFSETDKKLKALDEINARMQRLRAKHKGGVMPPKHLGSYHEAVLEQSMLEQNLKQAKSADERAKLIERQGTVQKHLDYLNRQRTPIENNPQYQKLQKQAALLEFERDASDIRKAMMASEKPAKPAEQRAVAAKPTTTQGEVEPGTPVGPGERITRMEEAKAKRKQKTQYQSKGVREKKVLAEGVKPASAQDMMKAWQEVAAKRATAEEQQRLDMEAEGGRMIPKEVSDHFDAIEQTPLSVDNLEQAHNGQLDKILGSLAQTGSTPTVRELAEKLQHFTKNTKVIVTDNVDSTNPAAAAVYDAKTNTVRIHPMALTEENTLHEVVHAATLHALSAPENTLSREQVNARKELQSLLNRVQKDPEFAREYGKKDLGELAAEIMTNPALRAKLDAQRPGLLRRFANAVMQMLGMKPQSASARAMANVEMMFRPSREFSEQEQALLRKMTGGTTAATAARAAPAGPMSELGAMITAAPRAEGLAGAKEMVRDSNAALAAEMAIVDQRAPILKALSKGDQKAYQQSQYYLRKADARMEQTYAALAYGPPQLKQDAKGNRIIEAGNGPSAKQLFKQIGELPGKGAAEKFATAQAYMVAQRAANKGWAKLGFDTAPELRAAAERDLARVNADPKLKAQLEGIRDTYNKYNQGMVQFLADSGAISKETAKTLMKDGDYVPFYRIDNATGAAELVMGEGAKISVGDIRKQPFLQQLKGDTNTKLMPLNEAIMRNTMLLTDMGLSNLSTKEIAYGLQGMSPKGTNVIMPTKAGGAPSGADIVKFRQDGKDYWMRVQSEGTPFEGIPAEMLVQSLEGSHAVLTGMGKVAQHFGDFLRKGVTRNPAYVLRQLLRDPMGAAFTAGTSRGMLGATAKTMREFVSLSRGGTETGEALLRKGVTQSGIFTGSKDDLAIFAHQLAQGDQGKLEQLLAMADRAAMRADAATRSQIYEDALKSTGSEMQAELAAIEMMNFSKHGSSPTIQHAARMIPFLNAQIQSLNVLAKAFRGNMPAEEALQIKEKFQRRAMGLAAFTLAYAIGMEDNDEYKKASADERFNNFFIPTPGGTIKVPIPYEPGLLFKALPEALARSMSQGLSDADQKALAVAFLHSIPGASSGLVVPQMAKPAFELAMNKRLYDLSPIETAEQQKLAPSQRYNDSTTETAKWISSQLPEGLGASPVRIQHAVGSAVGSLPVAVASLAESFFSGKAAGPEKKVSQLPVVGQFFGDVHSVKGITEDIYNAANETSEVAATYKHLIDERKYDEAKAYMQENKDVLAKQAVGEVARKFMTEARKQRKQIAADPALSPPEKRKRIDELDDFVYKQGNQFRQELQQ